MRKLSIFGVLFLGISGVGCWSSPAANTTIDSVSEPGVTQPPPPDPDKIAAANPRDRRNRKERPDMDPSATPEATEPRPAAENSEVSVMMNSDGSITEFRVFKDHPQIAKAEANWMLPNEKILKVLLKNGKTHQATTDKVPYLHTVPSSLLLEIVGVKPLKSIAERPRIVDNK